MLVKIQSDIYNNEQCFDLLDRLACLFVFDEGRHFWYIENPDEVLNSEWLKGETRLKKRIEELIEKLFMVGGYLTPQEKLNWHFSFPDGVSMPLCLAITTRYDKRPPQSVYLSAKSLHSHAFTFVV
jgi:hypothetical protein